VPEVDSGQRNRGPRSDKVKGFSNNDSCPLIFSQGGFDQFRHSASLTCRLTLKLGHHGVVDLQCRLHMENHITDMAVCKRLVIGDAESMPDKAGASMLFANFLGPAESPR
jgi:hypothetical protein